MKQELGGDSTSPTQFGASPAAVGSNNDDVLSLIHARSI